MIDVVFGPSLVSGQGGYPCPDCGAPAGVGCRARCDRYAEDPGDPVEPRYDDEDEEA
jgi:hypothetical protein